MSAAAALKPGCALVIGANHVNPVDGRKEFVSCPRVTIDPGRTLVLGTGYVANAYLRALHFLGLRPRVLSRSWLDYTVESELDHFLLCERPQLVINAAGYTGNTVDDCERNKEECYRSLVTLPRVIGQLCARRDISLIHISSGCIFDGPGPFDEEAIPNNLGQFYAQCKVHAEMELAHTGARAWVFRIRMPFGHLMHRRNLLVKLSNYERVLDGLNSVTFIDEFAMRSYHLLQKAPPGVYHAAGTTPVRTAQIARMLFDCGLRKHPVELYPETDFLAAGHVRRSTTVLNVSKFEKFYGSAFGDPLVALRWCMENFGVAKPLERAEPYAVCAQFSSLSQESFYSQLAQVAPPPTSPS
jgi:dTDP-4-dehydrorhamnose reductase